MPPSGRDYHAMGDHDLLVQLAVKMDGLSTDVTNIKAHGCTQGVRHTEQLTTAFNRITAIENAAIEKRRLLPTWLSLVIAACALILTAAMTYKALAG